MDVPSAKKQEVCALFDETKTALKGNLKWAKEIFQFCDYLISDGHGQGLESYYQHLPESLRGYVELVYDYHHRPSVRFIEGLLYESEYYREDLQSMNLMQVYSDSSRQFFLNTPRLKDEIGSNRRSHSRIRRWSSSLILTCIHSLWAMFGIFSRPAPEWMKSN